MATDDASSNSSDAEGQDAENEADEGEVTDAQKKVAEAAGLTEQVSHFHLFITGYLVFDGLEVCAAQQLRVLG